MRTDAITCERVLRRLGEIVRRREKGEVPLEEALALVEEGRRLAGSCSRLLDEAELKVVQLTKGADGAPQETELADAGI